MVSEFIERIALLQAHENEKIPSGMFESFRENKAMRYKRLDSNVFGSASVGYILKSLKPLVSQADEEKLDKILSKISSCFEFYRSKDGHEVYNFWQTNPSQHFPNGYFMERFKHFKLPDDVDDTSLVYMTKGYSMEEVSWLKAKLKQHAFPDRVYSTWFGLNMPLEKDVCALCNLMCLLLESKVAQNDYDIATFHFLNSSVVSGEIIKNTFWVSRHYASVPLIVYHYARLLGRFEIGIMAESKDILIEIIPSLFAAENAWMNKVLLQTAYLKLNQCSNKALVNWNALDESNTEIESFYSFIGAPFAPLENKFLKNLGSKRMLQIGWKCEAHEQALILENLVLRESYLKRSI